MFCSSCRVQITSANLRTTSTTSTSRALRSETWRRAPCCSRSPNLLTVVRSRSPTSFLYFCVWIVHHASVSVPRYVFYINVFYHSTVSLFYLKTGKPLQIASCCVSFPVSALALIYVLMCVRFYSQWPGLSGGRDTVPLPLKPVLFLSSLRCWRWRWRKRWCGHEYWPIRSLSVHISVS